MRHRFVNGAPQWATPDEIFPLRRTCAPVANIKSQIKRNITNEKRRLRNRTVRSELRTRTKAAVATAEAGEGGAEELVTAMRRIDKASAKGVIHANAAARQKSRLQKRINALDA